MTKASIMIAVLVFFVTSLSIAHAYETAASDSFKRPTLTQIKIDPTLVSVRGSTIRAVIELEGPAIEFLDYLTNVEVAPEAYSGNLLQVSIASAKLEEIARAEFVRYIRSPARPVPFSVSEGVRTIQADLAQNAGLLGEGVKIAVIDLGFDVTNPEIASNIVEFKSFRADGDIKTNDPRHGTAVAEILVDVAPRVELYLFNADTDVEFLNALEYGASRGVGIISLSIGFFNVGPYDGTSRVSRALDDVRRRGILPIVAAGNEADSHWEGVFSDPDNDGWHNFEGDVEVNQVSLTAGDELEVYLSWDDWPRSSQNYELYLYDQNLNLVATSTNAQNGLAPPTEEIAFKTMSTARYQIAIFRQSATRSVTFELFTTHPLTFRVAFSSIGNLADTAGAITVGATNWSTDQIEIFSSLGPTNDGRIKPDLSGPDRVTTSSYGTLGFAGTSAATPHVAGLAALLLGANPSLTADELQNLIENASLDLGANGKDNVYGSGRVRASFVHLDVVPRASQIIVDGTVYQALPTVLIWPVGSTHSLQIPESTILKEEGARFLFLKWTLNGASATTLSTLTMTYTGGPALIRAEFLTQHLLTVGSPYETPLGSGWYNQDSIANFSINPLLNHGNSTRRVFTRWSVDSNAISPEATILMNGPKVVIAIWKTQYFLSVNSPYSPVTGGGWYDLGEVANFSVTPVVDHGNGTRRIFLGWTGDVQSHEASGSLTIEAPKMVLALWKTQYQISFDFRDASGQREITPSAFNLVQRDGSQVRLNSYIQVWLDSDFYGIRSIIWMGTDVKTDAAERILVNAPDQISLRTKVYPLTVRVSDVLGFPVENIPVMFKLANDTQVSIPTSKDGFASIELAPIGTFEARVETLGQTVSIVGDASQRRAEEVTILVSLPLLVLASIVTALLASIVVLIRRRYS